MKTNTCHKFLTLLLFMLIDPSVITYRNKNISDKGFLGNWQNGDSSNKISCVLRAGVVRVLGNINSIAFRK